ncbi:MAG: PAS domain-containing protein [Gammaproteobacteria bacterium]
MKKAIQAILPTAEAIQRLLHPYVEVVIHDIGKNKIVAIYNSLSKRKVGNSSLLSDKGEMATLENCIGPYEKINWDGRKFKSMSSIIRDENGKAVGLLCINLDTSKFVKLNAQIAEFINYPKINEKSTPLFKDDWQERINNYVHTYLAEKHLTLETLDRNQKKKLIEHLHKIGAFAGRNAVHYIAQVIKVSRATVYNYLS